MGRRNRECYLCGKDYQYCPTCSQDKMKPVWMSEFHSENCKKIFDICTRFNMNLMSKAEARNALNACDISNKSDFKSYVQRDLDVIFFEEEPIVVSVETEIKEVSVDKAVVETRQKSNKKKRIHEVVIKEENE